MDKDKITQTLKDLTPDRLVKLQNLALSQMTDEQKFSPVHQSIMDLKCRKIMSRYI